MFTLRACKILNGAATHGFSSHFSPSPIRHVPDKGRLPKGRLHPSPEGSRKRCSGKPSRKLGFESCSWMNFKLVEENLRCPACTLNHNCHLNEPRAWSPLLSVFWGWNPRSGQDHASAVLASRAVGLPLWGVSILSWARVRLGITGMGRSRRSLMNTPTYPPTAVSEPWRRYLELGGYCPSTAVFGTEGGGLLCVAKWPEFYACTHKSPWHKETSSRVNFRGIM